MIRYHGNHGKKSLGNPPPHGRFGAGLRYFWSAEARYAGTLDRLDAQVDRWTPGIPQRSMYERHRRQRDPHGTFPALPLPARAPDRRDPDVPPLGRDRLERWMERDRDTRSGAPRCRRSTPGADLGNLRDDLFEEFRRTSRGINASVAADPLGTPCKASDGRPHSVQLLAHHVDVAGQTSRIGTARGLERLPAMEQDLRRLSRIFWRIYPDEIVGHGEHARHVPHILGWGNLVETDVAVGIPAPLGTHDQNVPRVIAQVLLNCRADADVRADDALMIRRVPVPILWRDHGNRPHATGEHSAERLAADLLADRRHVLVQEKLGVVQESAVAHLAGNVLHDHIEEHGLHFARMGDDLEHNGLALAVEVHRLAKMGDARTTRESAPLEHQAPHEIADDVGNTRVAVAEEIRVPRFPEEFSDVPHTEERRVVQPFPGKGIPSPGDGSQRPCRDLGAGERARGLAEDRGDLLAARLQNTACRGIQRPALRGDLPEHPALKIGFHGPRSVTEIPGLCMGKERIEWCHGSPEMLSPRCEC